MTSVAKVLEAATKPHSFLLPVKFWEHPVTAPLSIEVKLALFACWSLADEKGQVWIEPVNLLGTLYLKNSDIATIKEMTEELFDRGFLSPVPGNPNKHCARVMSFDEIDTLSQMGEMDYVKAEIYKLSGLLGIPLCSAADCLLQVQAWFEASMNRQQEEAELPCPSAIYDTLNDIERSVNCPGSEGLCAAMIELGLLVISKDSIVLTYPELYN